MPQVKGRKTAPPPKRGRKAPEPVQAPRQTDPMSIVIGLVMVLAVIVAGAALMGGSMSRMNTGVTGAVDGVASSFGFAVADVRVVGLEQNPERARLVQALSEVEPGDNMFRSDPHRIRRRILATGQVTEARVYRLWPNQILIRTAPARAAAVWHDGNAWQVIDTQGRLMEGMNARDYADLFRLSGAKAPDGVPALLKFLAETDGLAAEVSYAERVSARRWNVKLRSGMLILLPPDAGVSRAAGELMSLDASSDIIRRPLDRLDLRVTGRTFLEPSDDTGADGAPAES